MPDTADVVVVGGGVVGTSVAFHLCSRRAGRVVLCERRFLAAGATGKSGALVRMHYTNEPEARLAAASLPYFQHWSDLVGPGSSGFVNTGMLRFVATAHEGKLRANVAMLRRLGINTTVMGSDNVRAIVPSWRTDDIVAAAYEPDSGMADPIATTHGFASRAAALGADVRLGTDVRALRVAKGRIEAVETSAGSIAAPAVVVAGGAWAMPLLRQVGAAGDLTTVRTQVTLFRRPPEHAALHPICIDGANDLWLRPEGPGWGSTLVGISTRQELPDPDALDEGVDGDYVVRAKERLARRMPGIGGAPMRGGWAGAITITPDGKQVIDRHPEIEGLWICTGDNGSGFKTAPALGAALAEWMTAGAPRTVPLRPFRATRFKEGDLLIGENEYGDRLNEPGRGVMLG
ncbi:MAG TPA: FAD-binding oxidoreductase [bacterium]|nr:FAD-binding oxidoreductase [bacterium]